MNKPLNIAFFVSTDVQAGTYFIYHNFAVGLMQRGHQVTVYSQNKSPRYSWREEFREGVRYILAPSAHGNSYVAYHLNPGNILICFLTIIRYRDELAQADVIHLFQPLRIRRTPASGGLKGDERPTTRRWFSHGNGTISGQEVCLIWNQ